MPPKGKTKKVQSDGFVDPNLVQIANEEKLLEQYENNQAFLLTGIADPKEELKSRMSFVDTYKDEIEGYIDRLKKDYGLDKNADPLSVFNHSYLKENADKQFPRDMIKDYISYQHMRGQISDKAYDEYMKDEPEAEKVFRNIEIPKEEQNFIIEDSAFSDEKKAGIRENRKWMYRNCSKSDSWINGDSTRRNYIDKIGKLPIEQQVNIMYQVESGLYKVEDATKGLGNKEAMSNNYIPSVDRFRDKMCKSKISLKRLGGDFKNWSRLERAFDKTMGRADELKEEYNLYKDQKEKNNTLIGKLFNVGKKKEENTAEDDKIPLTEEETKKVKDTVKDFVKLSKNYSKCLKEYVDKRDDKKRLKALQKSGEELQRFYKTKDNARYLAIADEGKNEFEHIVNMSKELKDPRKMSDLTVSYEKVQATADKVEAIEGKIGLARTGFSVVKTLIPKNAITETAGKYSSHYGVLINAAKAVKHFAQGIISWKRKNKAENLKKENDKDILKDNGKEVDEKEKQQPKVDKHKLNKTEVQKDITIGASVSKKDNKWARTSHFTTAAFCAAGAGIGAATIFGAPLTAVGTVVAIGGVVVGKSIARKYRQNVAKKNIDRAMKMEDTEYTRQVDENGKKAKRYIDVQVDKRREVLQAKKDRFAKGDKNDKILDKYIRSPSKLKERVRTNFVVDHGGSSMFNFVEVDKKRRIEQAYRHLFLKDPDGEITKENLIGKEEFEKYHSEKQSDLEATGQTREQARERIKYKDLLKSEGVSIKAPKDVEAARKMFHSRPEAEKLGLLKKTEHKNAPEKKGAEL